MGEHHFGRRPSMWLVLALVLGAALFVASPLGAASRHEQNSYKVTPLVSDQPGVAPTTDPNLVNAWGLTAGPTTPWWVADNGKDKSTLYGGDGTPRALVVDVAGGPTGTTFNPTAGFVLPTGGKALFLFDGEDVTELEADERAQRGLARVELLQLDPAAARGAAQHQRAIGDRLGQGGVDGRGGDEVVGAGGHRLGVAVRGLFRGHQHQP